MYSPAHYREDRPELAKEVIRRFPFATLISVADGEPFVSHIPLLLEGDSLVGHVARANPHWKHFANGKITAVFHGPHFYISPAWYAPADDNVPTWNYVTVHVKGTGEILDDVAESKRTLRTLVEAFETKYGTNWVLPDNQKLDGLSRGIVAFRIRVEHVDAKFKLSQKKDAQDRETVIRELARFNDEARGVAEYMKRLGSD